MELRGRGMETREKTWRVRVDQSQSLSHPNTKSPDSERGVERGAGERGIPHIYSRETKRGAGERWCWDLEPVACWERQGSQSLAPVWRETPRDHHDTESALGQAEGPGTGAEEGGRRLSLSRTGWPPGESIGACRGAHSRTTSERGWWEDLWFGATDPSKEPRVDLTGSQLLVGTWGTVASGVTPGA